LLTFSATLAVSIDQSHITGQFDRRRCGQFAGFGVGSADGTFEKTLQSTGCLFPGTICGVAIAMPFQRPKPIRSLDKEERAALLQSYFDHYREAAKHDVQALNQRIPREEFDEVLDRIGCILRGHETAMAGTPGPIRKFPYANPLPKPLDGLLPDKQDRHGC